MEVSTHSHKDPKANTNQESGLWVKPIDEEDCKTSMQDHHHHNCNIITLNKLSLQECDQDHQEEEQNHLQYFNFIVPFLMPATPPHSPKLNNLEILWYEVLEKNDTEDNLNDKLEIPSSPKLNNLEILSYEVLEKNANKDNLNNNLEIPSSAKLNNLEISSYEVLEKNDNEDNLNDDFKTPTSLDSKILMILEPLGLPSKKIIRSATCCPSLMRDLSKELESMFTYSFMKNLNGVDEEM